MADDFTGPVGDLSQAIDALERTIDAIDSAWNARRHDAAVKVRAYRDAILAERATAGDPWTAKAIFALNGSAIANFLPDGETGDVVASLANQKQFDDYAKAAPQITADVAVKAATDAREKLGEWTSFSLFGLTGVALLAGVVAFVAVAGIAAHSYGGKK